MACRLQKRASILVTPNSPERRRRPKRQVSWPSNLLFESAVREGNTEEVKTLLLQRRDVDLDAMLSTGVTALHQSALDDNPALIRLLLQHGASVDAKDIGGWTPLHAASAMIAVDCIRLLLSAEADVYARTDDGELPLDLVDVEEEFGVACVKYLVVSMQDRHRASSTKVVSRASSADSGIDIDWDEVSSPGEVVIDLDSTISPLTSPEVERYHDLCKGLTTEARPLSSPDSGLEAVIVSGEMSRVSRRRLQQRTASNSQAASGWDVVRSARTKLRVRTITYV